MFRQPQYVDQVAIQLIRHLPAFHLKLSEMLQILSTTTKSMPISRSVCSTEMIDTRLWKRHWWSKRRCLRTTSRPTSKPRISRRQYFRSKMNPDGSYNTRVKSANCMVWWKAWCRDRLCALLGYEGNAVREGLKSGARRPHRQSGDWRGAFAQIFGPDDFRG